MRYRITRMTEHDLLEVVEIEQESGLSRWGWDGYHGELQNGHASLLLVARCGRRGDDTDEGRRIAGFIAARLVGDELHVNNIAVRHAFRGHGIGGNLLWHSMEEAVRLGASSACLEVRASNVPAQELYAQHGFRVVGRRPRYYANPVEDALLMQTHL